MLKSQQTNCEQCVAISKALDNFLLKRRKELGNQVKEKNLCAQQKKKEKKVKILRGARTAQSHYNGDIIFFFPHQGIIFQKVDSTAVGPINGKNKGKKGHTGKANMAHPGEGEKRK